MEDRARIQVDLVNQSIPEPHVHHAVHGRRADSDPPVPENGVSAALNDLWDSFDAFVLAPNDATTRTTVLSNLEQTAASFRTVSQGLDDLDQQPAERDVGGSYTQDIATLEFGKQGHLA